MKKRLKNTRGNIENNVKTNSSKGLLKGMCFCRPPWGIQFRPLFIKNAISFLINVYEMINYAMFHLTPVTYYYYFIIIIIVVMIVIIIIIYHCHFNCHVIIIIIIWRFIFRLWSIMLSHSCRIWHIIIIIQRPTFILGKSFASTKFIFIIMRPNIPLWLPTTSSTLCHKKYGWWYLGKNGRLGVTASASVRMC